MTSGSIPLNAGDPEAPAPGVGRTASAYFSLLFHYRGNRLIGTGRDERLEQARLLAAPGTAEAQASAPRDHRAGVRDRVAVPARVAHQQVDRVVRHVMRNPDHDVSAAGHRLSGVDQQVEQNLLQTALLEMNAGHADEAQKRFERSISAEEDAGEPEQSADPRPEGDHQQAHDRAGGRRRRGGMPCGGLTPFGSRPMLHRPASRAVPIR